MSELAFNASGESFEIPATVTGWRVRRMKPRGAPELVYGQDGRPLTVGIEADIDELREAVGTTGKYRLDPINDDGKCVENVPPAYVHVVKVDRMESAAIVATGSHSDDTVREAMKLNTELAKSVIDRFPEMMHAAAELLRAADGAGLPSRKPRQIEAGDEDDGEDESDELAIAAPLGFDLNALVAQIVPMLVTNLMSGKMKLPGLAAMFDWRKAKPTGDTTVAAHAASDKPARARATLATTLPAAEVVDVPPLAPAAMAHVIAIQSALEPAEVAFVQEVAKELSPADLRGWFDKLSTHSVPEAVVVIRDLIAGKAKTGGAS
ncbi:MAG: hypothetical protein ABJE66_39425 [Deltaproteobacteria bacterium]